MANTSEKASVDGRVSTIRRNTAARELILPTIKFESIFPPTGAYTILVVSYVAFVIYVEGEMLLVQHRNGQFMRQFICHNLLFGLTTYSLFLTSNRPPGSPVRSYSHDANGPDEYTTQSGMSQDERDAIEADFRGISLAEWKASRPPISTTASPRYINHSSEDQYERQDLDLDEDDVPLVNLFHNKPTSGAVRGEETHAMDPRSMLTVKGSSGGIRWCRKCNAVKPDRCHHCSTCGTCVLMMDHHCVWVAGCIGYRNKKTFILFLVYAALYAAYSALEAGKVCVDFFGDPSGMGDDEQEIEIKPVIWILLTLCGFVFFLTLAPFAVFHLYLVTQNLTSLEHMRPAFPNIKLADQEILPPDAHTSPGYPAQRPSLEVRRDRGWRPDHMLNRDERRRARRIAESNNPYDLGWRRNVLQVFDPDDEGPTWRWFWPGGRGGSSDPEGGQVFTYSKQTLERLREETARLRLGRDYHARVQDV